MKVFDYIAHETERQSGTIQEALGMYRAWRMLCEAQGYWYPLNEPRIKSLAAHIKQQHPMEYRKVPAVFNQGVPAVDASLVPHCMETLSEDFVKFYNPEKPASLDWANLLVKEFLAVHPFTDGNGRVASLIWNYLLGTLANPEPMPYFFGEA